MTAINRFFADLRSKITGFFGGLWTMFTDVVGTTEKGSGDASLSPAAVATITAVGVGYTFGLSALFGGCSMVPAALCAFAGFALTATVGYLVEFARHYRSRPMIGVIAGVAVLLMLGAYFNSALVTAWAISTLLMAALGGFRSQRLLSTLTDEQVEAFAATCVANLAHAATDLA
jgi:vacuolar-type H+-ATPase subunit I/STV1